MPNVHKFILQVATLKGTEDALTDVPFCMTKLHRTICLKYSPKEKSYQLTGVIYVIYL